MIGIGITSYNRPEHLRFCINQILKHTKSEFELFVYDQSDIKPENMFGLKQPHIQAEFYHEANGMVGCKTLNSTVQHEHGPRKGIAYAKNKCLDALKDCDWIFLLDEDCFPKSNNWIDYFINSNHSHTLYMNNRYKPYMHSDGHKGYVDSAGCFMYLTKEVIEKVGYFGNDYIGYGMEHAGFSRRIHRAGLTSEPYICLNDTNQYIHSLDLDGPFPGFDVEHKPSLSYAEMTEHIEHNRKVFELECTNGPIYQDFKP